MNPVFGLQESHSPDFTDKAILKQQAQRVLTWQSVKGWVGRREENEQACYVHEAQAQRDPCWQDTVIHGHRCRYITHLMSQSFFHTCLNDKNIAHFPHEQFGINFFQLKTALPHPHSTAYTRTAVWWGKRLKSPSIKFRKDKNANVFEFIFCRSKADEPTSTVPSTMWKRIGPSWFAIHGNHPFVLLLDRLLSNSGNPIRKMLQTSWWWAIVKIHEDTYNVFGDELIQTSQQVGERHWLPDHENGQAKTARDG